MFIGGPGVGAHPDQLLPAFTANQESGKEVVELPPAPAVVLLAVMLKKPRGLLKNRWGDDAWPNGRVKKKKSRKDAIALTFVFYSVILQEKTK